MEKIAALDTGSSVVVSAEGQPIVTITPTPDPTSLKGYVPLISSGFLSGSAANNYWVDRKPRTSRQCPQRMAHSNRGIWLLA